MRGSGHEIGRVLWKEGREHLGNNAGKLVLRNSTNQQSGRRASSNRVPSKERDQHQSQGSPKTQTGPRADSVSSAEIVAAPAQGYRVAAGGEEADKG